MSEEHQKSWHKARASFLSSDSDFNDFTGFGRMAYAFFIVGGLGLLLKNVIEYGAQQWINDLGGVVMAEYLTLLLLLYHIVPITICLNIEKALSRGILSSWVGMGSHIVNLLSVVLVPWVVISFKDKFSLVGDYAVCIVSTTIFLKMWSYIHANCCRTNPGNLTFRDILYFTFAPTLLYEFNFPRTERVRKGFLLTRALEVLAGIQIIFTVVQYWMRPYIEESLVPFNNGDFLAMIDIFLKLILPGSVAFLTMFYTLFHAWLNFLAELLRFADREFYRDWWNSTNMDMHWRSWNTVVHKWAVRHLYIPLVDKGFDKFLASMVVFLISGIFHEYIASVPLNTTNWFFFIGFLGHAPQAKLSRFMEERLGPRFVNYALCGLLMSSPTWPFLLYYNHYMVVRYGPEITKKFVV